MYLSGTIALKQKRLRMTTHDAIKLIKSSECLEVTLVLDNTLNIRGKNGSVKHLPIKPELFKKYLIQAIKESHE